MREESSGSSCGLGNQIIYIICLKDCRKNKLLTSLSKSVILFSFSLTMKKQQLPLNLC